MTAGDAVAADELVQRSRDGIDEHFGAGTSARADRYSALIKLGTLRAAYSEMAAWAYDARLAGVVEVLGDEWAERITEYVQAVDGWGEGEADRLLSKLAFDLAVAAYALPLSD